MLCILYNVNVFAGNMSASEKKPAEKKSSEKKGEKSSADSASDDKATTLGNVIMEGGRLVKMEVDYSTTCDEKIPAAQKLAKDGRVQEAVESLMVLEKQTRTVSYGMCEVLGKNV